MNPAIGLLNWHPRQTLAEMTEIYLADERPWIIAYSGGKDSTAVVQLAYTMLFRLPEQSRTKSISVISNDTLVEAPPVAEHLRSSLASMERAAIRDQLPITFAVTTPELKNRFFVKVIGRGYPAPNRYFRWCTDKMKIGPTSDFIRRKISEDGEVNILLGTRRAESSQRAKSIDKHKAQHGMGALRAHPSLAGAKVYAPIESLETDDVWAYLLSYPPPWDKPNRDLWVLYGKASGVECPIVLDKTSQPCGAGRFGCWTCTVVQKDKSLQGLVDNGEETLEPLLDFRDWLKGYRDDVSVREPTRRNGRPGPGPFTLAARQTILNRLVLAEQESGLILLHPDELEAIADLWREDGFDGEISPSSPRYGVPNGGLEERNLQEATYR
ncbi:MAG TPA: DNA phosphorothioation system sulfurtransferase DndC [Armatimonadota bacterium]